MNFTCLCHTPCPRDAISSSRAVKVKERSSFSKAWITKTGQEIDISDVSCQLGGKLLWYKRILIYIRIWYIRQFFSDTKKDFSRGEKIVLIYPDFDVTDLDISGFGCIYFILFIIPFGKFGMPYPGKEATAAARAALPSPTSSFWSGSSVFP